MKATTLTLVSLGAMTTQAIETSAELEALKQKQAVNFDNFCKKFHKEYKTTEDYNTHLEQFV